MVLSDLSVRRNGSDGHKEGIVTLCCFAQVAVPVVGDLGGAVLTFERLVDLVGIVPIVRVHVLERRIVVLVGLFST